MFVGGNRWGFDSEGGNRGGFDSEGGDRWGFDSEGGDRWGIDSEGGDRWGIDSESGAQLTRACRDLVVCTIHSLATLLSLSFEFGYLGD